MMAFERNSLQGIGGGHAKWIKALGILVGLVLALLLAGPSRAEASNCTDLDECHNAALLEKAVADDLQNKGVFYRGYSQHYFGEAYNWNQKAIFLFAQRDPQAGWAKAMADDLSQKSKDNARASDEAFAQARHWYAAANTSDVRYVFIANSPEYEDNGTASVRGQVIKWGWKLRSKARSLCFDSKWRALVCSGITERAVEEAGERIVRWVLDMKDHSSDCVKTRTRYDVNPSTGYVERKWSECTAWK